MNGAIELQFSLLPFYKMKLLAGLFKGYGNRAFRLPQTGGPVQVTGILSL